MNKAGAVLTRKNELTARTLKAARAVSLVFHPFLIAPLAISLVLYLNSGDLVAAFLWAGLSILLFTVPLGVFVLYKLARKQLTDADVSRREQRPGVYIFGAICMTVCFGILAWLGAPRVMLNMFAGGLVTVFVFAVVTRFWTKVSVHVGAMTGATVAVAFYSWTWAIILAGATLLVTWSRLVLKRHLPIEVILGMLIAGSVIFFTMLLQQ